MTALLVLVAAGCGSDDDSPTTAPADTPSTTVVATTAPPAKAGAVLEESGGQPRQPLALRVAAGSTARVALVDKIGLQLTVDGNRTESQATPGTRTVIEQRVDRVDPDGAAHYSVTFTDVAVVSTTGVDPGVVRAVETSLSQLKGLWGTGTLESSGETRELTLETSRITDPAIRSTVSSISSQVSNLSTPFPREAVGVGARWSVKRSATINGVTMNTTTRYTLRSRTGDRYELDLDQEAASPPGPVDLPNLPAGARASVTNFSVQSKGQLSGELTRALPLRSNVSGKGDGTFVLTAGAERSTLRQELTLELSTAPA